MVIRKQLPAHARVDQLKKQAKDLLAEARAGSAEALERFRAAHPRLPAKALLADAQLVITREYGFASWPKLRARVDAIDLADPATAFVEAACVPLDGPSHLSGNLERANAILAEHPHIATDAPFIAAILGNETGIRRFLDAGGDANATGGLYDWDLLTYLCFSRYLRLDRNRAEAFLGVATQLLERGASANTGFYWQEHEPEPTFETAIYGAAGLANDAALTRLLLEHGADPNDGETAYHVPERYENAALQVLVESGKLNEASMTTLLHRKLDWHDRDAVTWLLDHGADPNHVSAWGRRALHHAVERNNPIPFFELLLAHGGDPSLPTKDGTSAVAFAARMGRADVLALFAPMSTANELADEDAFLAACACADASNAEAIAARHPGIAASIQAKQPSVLADFAGAGNTPGVALLLDLGFCVASRTRRAGAPDDTALHVAIWRGRQATVQMLVDRGAPLEEINGRGETPLAYAVRAQVQSEWLRKPSAEAVALLLAAGARVESVPLPPSGFDPVDALIRARRPPT